MTNEKMRAEFEAWHNQRAMRLAALVESTRVKFIAAGWEDSPPTHQRALLDVVSKVDEFGWDAWQAATMKATQVERERCALLVEAHWHIDGSFTAKEFADAIRLPLSPTGTGVNHG